METIFNYIDYRSFLKDSIAHHKSANPSFSFRVFNRRAGIRSSGFLKLVIDKKRNLGNDGIHKVAKGLGLLREEATFFEQLVRFNQSATHEDKDYYFEKISNHRKFLHAARPMVATQYRILSHWYSVAILASLGLDTDAKRDVDWLHEQIRPTVLREELRRTVTELISLGLVREDNERGLIPTQQRLTTDDQVQSIALTNFHAQMCDLAQRALLKAKPEDREFSGLTVSLSQEAFRTVKQKLREFRKELHSLLQEEDRTNPKKIVAHVSLLLFQLAKTSV